MGTKRGRPAGPRYPISTDSPSVRLIWLSGLAKVKRPPPASRPAPIPTRWSARPTTPLAIDSTKLISPDRSRTRRPSASRCHSGGPRTSELVPAKLVGLHEGTEPTPAMKARLVNKPSTSRPSFSTRVCPSTPIPRTATRVLPIRPSPITTDGIRARYPSSPPVLACRSGAKKRPAAGPPTVWLESTCQSPSKATTLNRAGTTTPPENTSRKRRSARASHRSRIADSQPVRSNHFAA